MWQHFADNDPARMTGSTGSRSSAPLPVHDDDEVQRVVRDLAPWAIAITMHAGMVLLAVLLVWANLKEQDVQEDVVPSFVLNRPADRLQMKIETRPRVNTTSPTPPRGTVSQSRQMPTASSKAPAVLTIGIHGAEAALANLRSASDGTPDGLFNSKQPPGTHATTFAFVIDASGSMVDTMPFVIHELKRSLRTLGEKHSYTVLFYQNGQVIEPLAPGLKKATRDNILQMMDWLDDGNIAPNGLTSPLAAVQTALKYRPELMYLLSDNITGRGIYEIRQDVLLTQIKNLNEGRTKINTIQFLHEDPLKRYPGMRGTLELISEQSGGLNRFVRPSDIWLDAPLSQ